MKVLWLLLGAAFLIHAPALAAQDWQGDVRWAYDDHGAPDCPQLYVAYHIEPCLGLGNRQCVTRVAIAIAEKDSKFDELAFHLMRDVTQCHPDGADARARLDGAGVGAGANYLRTFPYPNEAEILDLVIAIAN